MQQVKMGKMKIGVWVLVLNALFSALAVGLNPSSAAAESKPKIVIGEKVHDFGTVTQGTKVQHEFTLRNEGDAPLVIQRVVPACGCTAATSTTEPIEPGASGTITVEFDTTGFAGSETKHVRVLTNDHDNLSLVLALKGTVEPDVIVEPQSVMFNEVVRGIPPEQQAKIVTVRSRSGSGAKITGVKSFSKLVAVEDLGEEGGKFRFRVSVDPSAPIGELRERVIINVSGAKQSAITVPVFASVKGQLALQPSQVAFGIIEGDQPLERAVKIVNKGTTPVQIQEVKSDLPGLSVKVKEIEPGRNFVLQLSLDPSQVKKDPQGVVEIKTSSAEEGTLFLNVFGVVPPEGGV